MKKNNQKQIIYVLTNEAMPGIVKIGKTTNSVKQRMRSLYNSGVPVPFECFHASVVSDSIDVEKRLHNAFKKDRINKNREFFEIEPECVLEILGIKGIEIEDVTPSEDPVETPDDKTAIEKLEKRRENFSFEMVDIPPGSTLTFEEDENKTAQVIKNNKVIYKGQELSLSAAALQAKHELGHPWKSAHGAAYWEYEGETLKDRRKRMEAE